MHPTSRQSGLAVIGLVLLAAVVVIPGTRTKTVPGTGQAAPAAGSPTIGDCVTDPIDPSLAEPTAVHAASGATTVTYVYPQVGMGSCRGSRYGEVTALIANPSKAVVSENASDSSTALTVNDANITACQQASERYVGIAAATKRWAPLGGGWFPNQAVATAASTPSARQLAAGQHWLACIVYVGADIGNPESFADQERYSKPLRNALTTGANSNLLGTCIASTSFNDIPTGCGTAHQSEIFASSGTQTRALAPAGLQQSCAQVVRQATDIPDITAKGFTVQVMATGNGIPVITPLIPSGALVTCGVTANHDRLVDGSLLALGDQPIPWSHG